MVNNAHYKWFILILIGLTAALVSGMPEMAMPVLFSEISQDLGLNLVQIGAVWGVGSLAGVITALLGGLISDRYGTKPTLVVTILILGVAGALRGVSNSFVSLAGLMLLSGFLGSMIPLNLHKVCGEWFSGKNLGLANGSVSSGMALGFMTGSMLSASVLSPWLGGWRQVLFFYGGIAAVMSIPWALSKSAPVEKDSIEQSGGPYSILESLSQIVKLRNVWLLGVAFFGVLAAMQGFLGYLPLYLREIGWSPIQADGALTAAHLVGLVIVFPAAYYSDRLGTRKKFLLAGAAITIVGTGLLAVVEGSMIWLAVILTGAVRNSFMAVFFTWVREQKGVRTANSGVAIGLALMLGRFGALISPPLGNSLGIYNMRYPFVLWAVMALFGAVILLFIKEDKTSAQEINVLTP